MQWFRDQLGIIRTADEIEPLAASVEDNGGAYIVPAFSGLFAPYWRSDARGARRGHGPDPLRHQGAPGACGAGGDELADA